MLQFMESDHGIKVVVIVGLITEIVGLFDQHAV